MISVAVPAYEAERTLARALKSLAAQTYSDFEVLVVDDGSSDRTREIAEGFAAGDPRFHVFSKDNGGTSSALRHAWEHATYDLFVSVDADDEVTPNFLEMLAADAKEYPDYAIWARNLLVTPACGRVIPFYDRVEPHDITLEEMLGGAVIPGAGTMYRREVFESLGGHRPIRRVEDQDFWMRALAAGYRHRFAPGNLYVYHLTAGQKSAAYREQMTSRIDSVQRLIDSGELTDQQRRIAESWIASVPDLIQRQQAEVVKARRRERLRPYLGWAFPIYRCLRRLLLEGDRH